MEFKIERRMDERGEFYVLLCGSRVVAAASRPLPLVRMAERQGGTVEVPL